LKLARGSHWLRVQAPGFSPRRVAVEANKLELDIELSFAPIREEITVTADPGRVEEVATTAQQVNVVSREEIELRAKSVTAQVANEEPGLLPAWVSVAVATLEQKQRWQRRQTRQRKASPNQTSIRRRRSQFQFRVQAPAVNGGRSSAVVAQSAMKGKMRPAVMDMRVLIQ
jgi:hypothetical protein